ncbi:MAG: LamG-like jellyroll fold domain-containing protein, partial [Phycisphaerae bacterium]
YATSLTTLNIAATTPAASETGPTNGVFTVTRQGTSGNLTVNYAVAGSATNGVDYTTLTGTVTIPDGSSSATITVAPVNDTLVELTENVILSLSVGTGYVVGSPNAAVVTIVDNDTVDLPTSLKALWRLDEGTGTVANDTANGTANNGTITGATWAAGKIGNSLVFNGTSSYVTVTDTTSSELDMTSAMTVAVWAKGATTSLAGNDAFVSKASAYTFGPSAARTIRFQAYIGGAYRSATYVIPAGPDLSQWHHYAATFNGTTLQLYFDGAAVGTPTAYTGTIAVNNNALYLGRIGSIYFNGSLDEARLYNAALIAADISSLYNQAALSVTGLTVSSANGASYSVQSNLNTGVTQYGDLAGTFTTIPSKYLGSTFIRTANADQSTLGTTNLLTFTVNQTVVIYILHADSYVSKPAWLSDFTDTTDNIVTTKGTFSVYKKIVSAGTITLGGNTLDGLGAFGMYGVLIVPIR